VLCFWHVAAVERLTGRNPVDANGVDPALPALSSPWSHNVPSADAGRPPSSYSQPVSSYPPSTYRWRPWQCSCPNKYHMWKLRWSGNLCREPCTIKPPQWMM